MTGYFCHQAAFSELPAGPDEESRDSSSGPVSGGGLGRTSKCFLSPLRPQVSKLIVLDPHKRLRVREALQHPWVLGKAARFSHMDTTQRKLQEFNARRKLKVRREAETG